MNATDLAIVGLWSYGVATAGFLAFAARLTIGWHAGLRAGLLLSATVVTVGWAAAGVAVAYRPGMLVWTASTVADALRYAVWFLFLGNLLQGTRSAETWLRVGLSRWIVALVVVVLVACFFLPVATPFVASVAVDAAGKSAFGLRLVLAISGLILVEQLIRRAEPSARWALKPLCVGLAGVFAFDLYFFADAMLYGRLDADLWVARGTANALIIPFIAVATARNPGWTIEMHVSRGAVVHSTAVLVSGVFLLLIAGAGYIVRFIGGEWGRALQIEFLFLALLLGILVGTSGRFRSKLRVFVSKHFFSYRYDYREEWLRFTRTLADGTRSHGVQEQAIRALCDLVESPAGALWVQQEGPEFRLVSRWNMPAKETSDRMDGSLPSFLERTGWVIDLVEYTADRNDYAELDIPQWLRNVSSAWLVVPLLSGTELVGIVVLTRSRATIDVDWEVRDLLKVAGRQAASYLGQIRATEALVEARKFDAFNRMSAFVVHDLKNLVAQLSLLLKNAERHRDNPEFQRDMLTTIEHVVGRMNSLMLQLRMGTDPVEKPRLTDLESLVHRVCGARVIAKDRIHLELVSGIKVFGHEDRLDHVIGHLVQNALDATAGEGRVEVRLFRDGVQAVLEVEDTGVGMSQEFMREHLFRPFESSKPSGMGIGVYESHQYVTSIGGTLHYDSTLGQGTRVRMLLSQGESGLPAVPAEVPA